MVWWSIIGWIWPQARPRAKRRSICGRRRSVGADKAYDTAVFVEGRRSIGVTPHLAQDTKGRRSAINRRTTRHPGHEISQVTRKLMETIFGDAKQHGTLRQLKLRGLAKARMVFSMVLTAVNLRRLPA